MILFQISALYLATQEIPTMQRRSIPAYLGGLALLSSVCATAQTTINVTSADQVSTTDCTLSNAIASSNTAAVVGGCTLTGSGAPYTIQLQNQTYTMASVDNYWYGPNAMPPIATNIIIEGNGAMLAITDSTIVRLRFFYVGADPDAVATLGFNTPGAGRLTLRNLTLTGGRQRAATAELAEAAPGWQAPFSTRAFWRWRA
jgi:hypothetical protein